jgi:hypothetical protein
MFYLFKDALTLQRVCLEKKMELSEEGSCDIPDVRAIIQELTTSLFISTYNYQVCQLKYKCIIQSLYFILILED